MTFIGGADQRTSLYFAFFMFVFIIQKTILLLTNNHVRFNKHQFQLWLIIFFVSFSMLILNHNIQGAIIKSELLHLKSTSKEAFVRVPAADYKIPFSIRSDLQFGTGYIAW